MLLILLLSFATFAKAQSGGCLQRVDVGGVCACAGIPSDNRYFLTAFDDGGGESDCACGSCHKYGPYFLADKSRWGCGAKIKMCRPETGRCIVAQVVDFGPGCRIDTAAGGPVIDASYPICQYLFGVKSCGYSDHYSIVAVKVSSGTPLGPSSSIGGGGGVTTTVGGTTASPINGPACNYKQRSGACITTSSCRTRGGQAFSSRAGASGCRAFAANVQCCLASSSLLNDEIGDVTDDDSPIADDEAGDELSSDSAAGERSKVVVAVAVSVVIVVLVLVAVAVVVMQRAKRNRVSVTQVPNVGGVVEQPAPSAPMATIDIGASSAAYVCAQCGNQYAVADDLAAHVTARH